MACLGILAAIPLATGISRGQSTSPQFPNSGGTQLPTKDTSGLSPLSRQQQTPGSITADDSAPEPDSEKRVAQLNALRQKEMEADSAKLLALATELKAALDKSGKDTLSLDVVRKAEQIEKLAHSVREKMKSSIPR